MNGLEIGIRAIRLIRGPKAIPSISVADSHLIMHDAPKSVFVPRRIGSRGRIMICVPKRASWAYAVYAGYGMASN